MVTASPCTDVAEDQAAVWTGGPITSRRDPTLWSFACRLRAQGYDETRILRTIAKTNRQHCVPPLDYSKLRGMARRAAKFKAGTGKCAIPREQADETRAELAELEAAVRAMPWRGPGATTRRKIVLALLAIAYECARNPFTASRLQIAERAGVNDKTVRKQIPRIMALGVLRIHRLARVPIQAHMRANPTAYVLQLPAELRQKFPSKTGCSLRPSALMGDSCRTALNGDIWRNGSGLGGSSQRVYEALSATPTRICDLERRLGICRRTIERALSKLASAELVAKTDDGWVLTGVDPEDANTRRPCGERNQCTAEGINVRCKVHNALGAQRLDHEAKREWFNDRRGEWQTRRERRERQRRFRPLRPGVNSARMQMPTRIDPTPTPSTRPPTRYRESDEADRRAKLLEQAAILMAKEQRVAAQGGAA